ncbi:MAG TPA: molybdopterin-dependent oxidoreductase [Firmicutes bacterium]|nr:molybdopterin-dependent oxidoreductase [Bacillota bacterium]
MKKRGRGMACMYYPLGFTSYPNPSAAFAKYNPDGSATVLTGAQDIGQGSGTVLAQIAADTLGIPYDRISLIYGDTQAVPMDAGSVASRVTYIAGNAVKKACEQAKSILLDVAADMLGVLPHGLDVADGWVYLKDFPEKRVAIADVAKTAEVGRGRPAQGHGTYNPATTLLDKETGHGKPYEAFVYAAQVAEVEVDTETGEVEVLKIYAVHDCGKAINPMMVEGQIEGGIAMGIGYGLTENLVIEKGHVLNPQLANYIVPTALDVPPIESAIVEIPEPKGPFGAKGIGEPSLLPTAPAILNAIYDAVGVRIRDLPATPEKILAELEKLEKEKAK